MTRRRPTWYAAAVAVALVALATGAYAGSSEPKLAIAAASASREGNIVTIEIVGNFDYDNAVRLGYPLSILVTGGGATARMLMDGQVGSGDAWTNLRPPSDVPGSPGVIAVGAERLTLVLPEDFVPPNSGPGSVTLRLEALFVIDGIATTIRSNAVEVSW